jgi:putative ABC transport system permease protein
MTPQPPRLAAWLLTRRIRGEWRDFVVGDLEEEFRARCAVAPGRARRWFWRQAIRALVLPLPPEGHDVVQGRTMSRRDSIVRTLMGDLRAGVRVAYRAPAFSAAVIFVLALGIGANTAIFSIVDAVLLRPLPFQDPARIVRLFHIPPQATFPGMPTFSVSAANFYDWQRRAQSFEGMAIYRFRQFTMTGGDHPESILAGAVGAGFFDLVRARPALGRVFRDDEDQPGREQVVILSDGFWRSHLGGSRDALGRSIMLDGRPYTVVGIMPSRFSIKSWGASGRDLWVPLAYTPEDRAVRDNHNAQVVARLKPGVTIEHARAEMAAISVRLEQEYPQANAGWGATVTGLRELIVGDIRASLVMLLAAVALVLLIACANVANLLFARGLARRKELAIRYAMGAGRRRVFQQLVIEALVLALAGGAVGLLFARLSLAAGAALLAAQVPRADEIAIDARVLLFVAGASVLTGILAGAFPAVRAGQADLTGALKEGGRSDAALGLRTRRLLIVGEVALSLILLMGAGVMVRTLVALRNVDAGFNPRSVLTMRITLPETKYKTAAQQSAFFDEALQRMRAIPGVETAGAIEDLPLARGSQQPIVIDGRAELLPRDQPTVAVRKITPGYLRAIQIPLFRGRDVQDSDVDVMLVSRAAAKLLWGEADPIGHTATLPLQSKTRTLTVIGVIGDVREEGLTTAPVAAVYEYTRERPWSSMALALRTTVDPESIVQPSAAVVRALDPQQPIEETRTMTDLVDETLTSQRFSALALGLFASVAMTLAAVGIYSVLSHIVRGRSREIGIRTALGARTGDVLRLVMYEGMAPTLFGVALGILGAFAFGTLLNRLVFGVSTSDPMTLALVAGLLVGVALIASLLPAYRASRLDPLKVLRIN